MFALTLLLLVAICTHMPLDASYLTLSKDPIQNLAGPFGSYSSDLILQTIGFGWIFLLLFLTISSLKITFRSAVSFIPIRIFCFCFGLLSLTLLLSHYPAPPDLKYKTGGFLGAFIKSESGFYFPEHYPFIASIIFTPILTLSSLFLSGKDWKKLALYLFNILLYSSAFFIWLGKILLCFYI